MTKVDPLEMLTTNSSKYSKLATEHDASHFIFGTLSDTIFSWDVYISEPNDGQLTHRELWAIIHLDKPSQWPKLLNVGGTLHGGAIATIIDGASGILFASLGFRGMTANLTINYRKPVPLPSKVLCIARINREKDRKIFITTTIMNGDEQMGFLSGESKLEYVHCDSLFIKC